MRWIKNTYLILVLITGPAFGQVSVHFNLQTNGSDFEVSKLRFYITNIAIEYSDGTILHEENSYHLIDMDYTKSQTLNLNLPVENIAWIQFLVGTDSLTNVAGILDGDLDPIKGMYWSWNTGYINFKVEGKRNGKEFEYHIGGYLPPYQTVQSKRVKIESNHLEINVDLARFLLSEIVDKKSNVLVPGPDALNLSKKFAESISTVDNE